MNPPDCSSSAAILQVEGLKLLQCVGVESVWLGEGLTAQGGAVGWSVKESGCASLGRGQLGDLKRSGVTVEAGVQLRLAAN